MSPGQPPMFKEKRNLANMSPLVLSIFSLTIILLLSFFVIKTLNDSLSESLARGLEITYGQFDRRERELAREEVEKFIATIRTVDTGDEEIRAVVQQGILDVIRTRGSQQIWNSGFFLFDGNGICLISYDYPGLEGYSIYEIREQAGVDLVVPFLDLKLGGEDKYVTYTVKGRDGERDRQKTAYLSYYAPWNWFVGAGFYTDRADSSLNGQKEVWEGFRSDVLYSMKLKLLIFSLLLFLAILTALVLLKTSISTRTRAQKRLALYKETLEDNLCVMITDPEGRIDYVNEKYCQLTGLGPKDLRGKFFSNDIHREIKKRTEREIQASLLKGADWNGPIRGRNVSGESFWLQAQIKPVREESGLVTGYIAVGLDVTELHRTRSHLEKSLFLDSLTGCGNRAKLLADYDRASNPLIAFHNIDRFNSINRFYGMERGDEVLLRIGEKFRSLLRGGENLYRIHADTFVIMKDGGDREEFIRNCRNRLDLLQNMTFQFEDHLFPVSLRMGISTGTTDTLILADAALNGAKASSGGVLIYNDEELDAPRDRLENLQKLNMIRQALDHNRVFLMYQPIIHLPSGEIGKYESLIRIRDDQGNIVSPGNFINLAKEGRIYRKLTHFVIERAFRDFSGREEDFSINLTIEDFTDRETIDLLIEKSRLYGVQERLILELVETEELRDFEGIVRIIEKLKGEGMRIAIDDFGSGFSNFTYLLRLNTDFIKIDGSLIRNILTDSKSRSLVTSIIQFARGAGIKTIAEYIETEELSHFARDFGIDFGQGYYLGKPEELPPIGR